MPTTHTPGPWIVGPHPGNDAGDDWRTILADTPEFGPLYIGEAIAPDARLAAAAPALLAALRAMLAKHDDRDGASDLWPREAAMAREAIAAATQEG